MKSSLPPREYIEKIRELSDRGIAANLDDHGIQIIMNSSFVLEECSLRDLRRTTFGRLRKNYDFLGNPKIVGWTSIHNIADDNRQFFCVKLYTESR